MTLEKVFDYYKQNKVFTRQQLVDLLHDDRPDTWDRITYEADQVRRKYMGNAVHIRGIIEFSNHCFRNCSYCGINRNNPNLIRYRIPPEVIVDTAWEAAGKGIKTVVLQSGEDLYFTGEMLADIVRSIKPTGMAITLSVGERAEADYRLWKEAGADRYLLKFETSNSKLYTHLHPGASLHKRLYCLEVLRRLGYQIGSGFMVGLPGQTEEMLADDIIFLQALKPDMAGIGPFIPHPSTPLGRSLPGNVTLSLKVLALIRLMLPTAHLPATTALSSLHQDGRKQGLNGGANVLMPNITPIQYRKLYEIYPHKAEIMQSPAELYENIAQLLTQMDREIANDVGNNWTMSS